MPASPCGRLPVAPRQSALPQRLGLFETRPQQRIKQQLQKSGGLAIHLARLPTPARDGTSGISRCCHDVPTIYGGGSSHTQSSADAGRSPTTAAPARPVETAGGPLFLPRGAVVDSRGRLNTLVAGPARSGALARRLKSAVTQQRRAVRERVIGRNQHVRKAVQQAKSRRRAPAPGISAVRDVTTTSCLNTTWGNHSSWASSGVRPCHYRRQPAASGSSILRTDLHRDPVPTATCGGGCILCFVGASKAAPGRAPWIAGLSAHPRRALSHDTAAARRHRARAARPIGRHRAAHRAGRSTSSVDDRRGHRDPRHLPDHGLQLCPERPFPTERFATCPAAATGQPRRPCRRPHAAAPVPKNVAFDI